MSSTPTARRDVFLSHATPDKDWVRKLCDHLKALGLDVYFDERELAPADNFVKDLAEDGLLSSRFLVLVLTEHAAKRPWVEWEYTTFMALHGPLERLIPVLLEGGSLPPATGNSSGLLFNLLAKRSSGW